MEFKIGNKFLIVKTDSRFGETEKLKVCGASLYIRKERRRDNYFVCPLQVNFIRAFITVFNLNHSGLNKLLNDCIARDRYHAKIMKECDYYRDHPSVPTPIAAFGEFTNGMRHSQEVSLYASLKIKRFGLFLDRGIGKSKVIIDNLTVRLAKGLINKILIVCPRLNVFNTWIPEIEKHSKVRNLPITTIVGDKDDKIQMLSNENRGMYIHVMTYAAMRIYKDMLSTYDILIFDESKAIAGDSGQSEAAFQLSSKANYVIEATGTVNTLKTVTDVFYQYKTLDLGATFGLKYINFQDEYFYDVGKYYPMWKLRKGSLEVIRALMFRIAISYKKSECLDLPPRTIKNIVVSPNKFQTHFTNALVDGLSVIEPDTKLKTFFEKNGVDYNKEAVAINNAIPISKVTKLQEITSGFYKPYTDKNIILSFDSAKLDSLLETLDTLKGEKVIIWCRFIYDIERLAKVLEKKKIKSYLVHGGKDEVKKWQKSKNTNVLIGMESIGKGLTLVEAAYMMYFSYTHSSEHFNQSIDRNYRDGQTRSVIVYIFQLLETIDQTIISLLNSNETLSKKLTDYQFKKIARGK